MLNVVLLTILWTIDSFAYYMLQALTKDYEGNIYLNFYFDGLAGIIGISLARPFYVWVGMRPSFQIPILFTILFGFLCMAYQQSWLSPEFVDSLGVPPCGEACAGDPEAEREHRLGTLIPFLVFFTKIGVNFTFQTTYLASFGENIIFPFFKRATAIGYCNFVARGVTILSPMAAELDRPIPAILLLATQTIGLITTFFLPGSEEIENFERDLSALAKKNDEISSQLKSMQGG